MRVLVQASLLVMAMIGTAPVPAQRAEPAVKPESEASVDEQRPLATEQTQPPVLIIELPPPKSPEPPQTQDQGSQQTTPHSTKIGIHRLIPEQWRRRNLAGTLERGRGERVRALVLSDAILWQHSNRSTRDDDTWWSRTVGFKYIGRHGSVASTARSPRWRDVLRLGCNANRLRRREQRCAHAESP